jgi:hypothetical protein
MSAEHFRVAFHSNHRRQDQENPPDTASQSQADRRVRNDAARSLSTFSLTALRLRLSSRGPFPRRRFCGKEPHDVNLRIAAGFRF